MKPKRIILVRHGECDANIDENKFATIPDYTIELTPKGYEQALEAGKKLKRIVKEETLYFYVSPFWRTRSTFEAIVKAFPRTISLFRRTTTQGARVGVSAYRTRITATKITKTGIWNILLSLPRRRSRK